MLYLTHHEKYVLLVLTVVIVCGAGIRLVFARWPAVEHAVNEPQRFVYQTNINTANFNQLVAVPYIGEKSARAILLYRQSKKKFTSLKELQDVPGIYPSNYVKMIRYLTL